MTPHKKAQELFDNPKLDKHEVFKIFENGIKSSRTKFQRSWWITVKSQYEQLEIKKQNENKS